MKNPAKRTMISAHQKHCSKFRKMLSIALCLTMGIAMVGCTKSGIGNSPNSTEDNDGSLASANTNDSNTSALNMVSADSNYFSSQDLDFYEAKENESVQVISVAPCKDQVAVLVSVITETAEGIDKETDTGYSLKCFLLFYDISGKMTAQKDMSEYYNTVSNGFGCAASDTNGTLNILVPGAGRDAAADADSTEYTIYAFDSTGSQVEAPIPISLPAGFYPVSMVVDSKGNRYVGSGGSLAVFDSSGEAMYDIQKESLTGELFLVGDTVYANSSAYAEEEKGFKCLLYPMNSSTKDLGSPVDISEYFPGGTPAICSVSDGICFSSSNGIDALNLETKEKKSLLYWKDLDIKRTISANDGLVVLSADKILLLNTTYTDNSSGDISLTLLTRSDVNPNIGKQIIILGGVGISSDNMIQTAVYDFNKSSAEYRVEIRDYYADAVNNGMDEYITKVSTMNLDILTGDGPDIICGSADLLSNYAVKGCLTDLYPLMEADSNFNKDDYMQSIFRLCETDGKLYQLCPYFMIQGLVGSASLIGDQKGWTVDTFNEMADSLPDGMKALDKNSQLQSTLLHTIYSTSPDTFINYSTGKVDFDSDVFCTLLAFTKENGRSEAALPEGVAITMDSGELIKNGELALENCLIMGALDYNLYVSRIGGPVSVTGYPSADGSGALCLPSMLLAVSSASDNTKASWEFVKSFLGKKIQETVYGVPVLRTEFEAQIEAAKDPDNQILVQHHAAPISEETAQAYRDMVDGLDTLSISDNEIYGIVQEEAAAYFADQKSAENVAAIIQNRVQTIMDERQ